MARYALCQHCETEQALTANGSFRRHPRGAPEPCRGFGRTPGEVSPTKDVPLVGPKVEPTCPPAVVRPGVYRSPEPMMETGLKPPPGYATVSVLAHIPYDGSNGRTPNEEAALLFADPDYLSTVLDAVPNQHVRIQLKVHS